MPGLAAVGVHLHQKQPSIELIEVEVERLAAAPVGSDQTAHQAALAHRNSQRFIPACCRRFAAGADQGVGAQATKQNEFHGSIRLSRKIARRPSTNRPRRVRSRLLPLPARHERGEGWGALSLK